MWAALCHSETVTDVTVVGIRMPPFGENGLPHQRVRWFAMTEVGQFSTYFSGCFLILANARGNCAGVGRTFRMAMTRCFTSVVGMV